MLPVFDFSLSHNRAHDYRVHSKLQVMEGGGGGGEMAAVMICWVI